VIQEVRTGQGKIIRAVAEVGGWPELAPGTAPADGDQDGMPNAWEKTHGLNPADAGDSRIDPDNDGYTNIEEYLNGTDPVKYVDYWVAVTIARLYSPALYRQMGIRWTGSVVSDAGLAHEYESLDYNRSALDHGRPHDSHADPARGIRRSARAPARRKAGGE
jgi:hypothetical protein